MPTFARWIVSFRRIAAIAMLLMLWAAPAVVAAETAVDPAVAEIIRKHGCPGCHVIPGIPEAVGTIGPSLKGISERPRIASGSLRNSPENLRRWLRNPKAVRMTMMPNTGLTEAEIDALIKFFDTL